MMRHYKYNIRNYIQSTTYILYMNTIIEIVILSIFCTIPAVWMDHSKIVYERIHKN